MYETGGDDVKKISMAVLIMTIAGCTTVRGYWYDVSSGKRADASAALLTRLGRAKTICRGESAKLIGSSTQSAATSYVLAQEVGDACMMKQGFELKAK